jgi:hypothetical protein
MFHDRNLDALPPPIPRDLAPLLLRLARVRLNVGSGSAGPTHLADHIGVVAHWPKSRPFLSTVSERVSRETSRGNGNH